MSKRQSAFPDGLVLGLTMAETAILIIFVLLLALTVLLGRETNRRQTVEQELKRYEGLKRVVEEQGLSVDEAIRLIETRTRDQRDAQNWRELVREVSERTDGGPNSPQAEGLIRDALRWRELSQEHGDDPATKLKNLEIMNAKLNEQLGGTGTDHPSCWYDANESVDYLFDVALADDGFKLLPTPDWQRREEQELPPLDDIPTDQLLNSDQFLAQTLPIFRWSVQRNCRFFVRVFDMTAAESKELYKQRMRTLESRFYKYASPSEPSPFVNTLRSTR